MEPIAGDRKRAELDDKSAGTDDKSPADDKKIPHSPPVAAAVALAGDDKSAGTDDKSPADDKKIPHSPPVAAAVALAGNDKSAVPDDQKRGVDGSGYDDEQVNAESLSSGSYDKREPRPHLPHDAGVGRSGSNDNKGGSGSRSAESEDKRAAPRSRLNPNAAEFIPTERASLTPSPPVTGGFRRTPSASTPKPSPTSASPSPASISSRPQQTPTPTKTPIFGSPSPSPASISSGPQPTPPQQAMQGFAAVTKHGSSTMKSLMEIYKERMLHYLNSADGNHYMIQATNLGRKLNINFEDLLQKDRRLAIQICKDRGSNDVWLNEACKLFFESKKLSSDDVQFEFTNIPTRLWEAVEFMQSKACTQGRSICSSTSYIETATEHGRTVSDLVLNRVLDDVADKGVSWDGNLTLSDILFDERIDGQVKVYISKSPVYKFNAPAEARLKDVKSIWGLIRDGCKFNETNLPLYFEELKDDLKNASQLEEWFIQYLRFHPALYSSTPRRYFVMSLQMGNRRLGLTHETEYSSLFTMKPIPGDWRTLVAGSGPLNDLLNFEFKIGTQKASTQTTKKNGEQKDQYKNSTGSLLDFVKNGLSHLSQYISVNDDDEIELFLALKFPKLLPVVMRGLLSRGGMIKRFADCWNTYRKTK